MKEEQTVDATTTSGTSSNSTGSKTQYVLLSRGKFTDARGEEIDGWKWEKNVEATSAEAAVRAAGAEGEFVAIPHRSFKPVKLVKKETVTFDITPA